MARARYQVRYSDRFRGPYREGTSSQLPSPYPYFPTADEAGFEHLPGETRSEPVYFAPNQVGRETGRVIMDMRIKRIAKGKGKIKVRLRAEIVFGGDPLRAEQYLMTHLYDQTSQPVDWDPLRAPEPPGRTARPPTVPSRAQA